MMKSILALCILPALAAAAFYPESLLCKINAYRTDRKLSALSLEPKLVNSTKEHSDYMAKTGRLTTIGNNNTTFGDRAKKAGFKYRTLGEFIMAGYRSDAEVFAALLAKPGNLEYVVSKDFEVFGAGMAYGDVDDLPYWTLDFGSSWRVGEGTLPKCGPNGAWLEEPNKPPTSAQASGIIKAERE